MKNAWIAGLLVLAALVSQAQADCCSGCGCQQMRKRCRLICETKKVTTFEYGCKCEDFCLPGKSQHCGVRCVPDCDAWFGHRKEVIWKPTCGCIKTRTYLTKVPVTKEVPSYRCVVECVCCGCNQAHVDNQASEAAQKFVDALPEAELKKLGEVVTTESDGSQSLPLRVVPTSAEIDAAVAANELVERPTETPEKTRSAGPFGLFRLFQR